MRKIKLLSLLALLGLYAHATVYYVSPTGTTGNNGLSWATAFPTLLEAQAKVTAPAEIWVQQGTYAVNDTTLTIYNNVNVYGGFVGNETSLNARSTNPALTILNGNKKKRVLTAASNITVETIWDGFTIQNGYAGNAGGVYLLKNTTLRNCIIQNNKNATNNGGGVYISTNAVDSVKLINCLVRNNVVYYNGTSTSPNGGGGVYMHSGSAAGLIRGCTIESNMVNGEGFSGAKMYGGGVFMCDGTLANSVINANKATSLDPETSVLKVVGDINAGGVFVMPGATSPDINLKNCKITGNLATIKQGGGLMINPYYTSSVCAARVFVRGCIISNNNSRAHGGGVSCDSQNTSSTAEYTFENTVIANNQADLNPGGGVFVNNKAASTVKFVNCTVVNNRMNTYNYGGAGIYFNNIATDITNCIFWGNRNAGTAPLKHHLRTAGVTGNVVTYCAFDSKFIEAEVNTTSFPADLSGKASLYIANSATGTDSLSVKFVSPTNFTGIAKTAADSISLNIVNWALSPNSGCVDAGATVRTLTTDILGTARPYGNGYDMGAYEYNPASISGVEQTIETKSVIYSINGAVVINNLDKLKQASVYTLFGSQIKTVKLTDGINIVQVPANQLYIVKAGNTAKKVLVK